MTVTVKSLLPQEGGLCYAVGYVLSNGDYQEEKHGHVFKETAEALGLAVGGTFDGETAEALDRGNDLFCAVRSALGTLNYGPKPPRALVRRLKEKGYAEGTANDAVAWILKKGLLHVDSALEQDVHAELSKLHGPSRIRQKLFEKGYDADVIATLDDLLAEVDFDEACLRFLKTKTKTVPRDVKEKQKLIASALRAGYGYATVKTALASLEKGK